MHIHKCHLQPSDGKGELMQVARQRNGTWRKSGFTPSRLRYILHIHMKLTPTGKGKGHPRSPRRGRTGITILSLISTLDGVCGQRHTPTALPPRKRNPYSLYRRLFRPQGQCGRVLKISTSPGFDPRTVRVVAIPQNRLSHLDRLLNEAADG